MNALSERISAVIDARIALEAAEVSPAGNLLILRSNADVEDFANDWPNWLEHPAYPVTPKGLMPATTDARPVFEQ